MSSASPFMSEETVERLQAVFKAAVPDFWQEAHAALAPHRRMSKQIQEQFAAIKVPTVVSPTLQEFARRQQGQNEWLKQQVASPGLKAAVERQKQIGAQIQTQLASPAMQKMLDQQKRFGELWKADLDKAMLPLLQSFDSLRDLPWAELPEPVTVKWHSDFAAEVLNVVAPLVEHAVDDEDEVGDGDQWLDDGIAALDDFILFSLEAELISSDVHGIWKEFDRHQRIRTLRVFKPFMVTVGFLLMTVAPFWLGAILAALIAAVSDQIDEQRTELS